MKKILLKKKNGIIYLLFMMNTHLNKVNQHLHQDLKIWILWQSQHFHDNIWNEWMDEWINERSRLKLIQTFQQVMNYQMKMNTDD
jgi:hypothetical protein